MLMIFTLIFWVSFFLYLESEQIEVCSRYITGKEVKSYLRRYLNTFTTSHHLSCSRKIDIVADPLSLNYVLHKHFITSFFRTIKIPQDETWLFKSIITLSVIWKVKELGPEKSFFLTGNNCQLYKKKLQSDLKKCFVYL